MTNSEQESKRPYYVGSNSLTPSQQMASSCFGASVTSIFVTPLDVVKIRLQAQQKEFLKKRCFLYCNGLMEHLCFCSNGYSNGNTSTTLTSDWYRRPGHFTGTVDALVKITRNEGILSLWSGLPPTLIMAIPATVVYFTTYDQTREKINKSLQLPYQPTWVPMVSGGAARVFSVTLISPFELVRTKMQSKKYSYPEIVQALRTQISHDGFKSLWRGWGATILRDVPFSMIYWAGYESFKQAYNQTHPSMWFSFGAGAIAGSIAATVTLPFDVIKTHRQIELGELEILKNHAAQKRSTSTFILMKELCEKRGFSALFTGFVPRVVKVAPACAIMISTYESGKSFFSAYNEKHKNR